MIFKSEEGNGWKIYHADAAKVLKSLDKGVSLIVTDPPYGISYKSGYTNRLIVGDDEDSRENVYRTLNDACSLLRSSQHLYVFGEWDLTKLSSVFKQSTLIWDKGRPGMGDLSSDWGHSWEPIQFAVGRTDKTRASGPIRKRRGTVLRHYPVTGISARKHPTEKPVSLLRELIEMSSSNEDMIIDPYSGSGSTGIAALIEGRRFTGIEIDETYFNISVARLKKAEKLLKDIHDI